MKKIILSDNKLNLLVDDVTQSLLAQHRFVGGVITGEEIAQFCPHQQVNQFVLFRIYQDGSNFVAQLSHPYFDFGHTKVKDDLRHFLDTLSRHIRVREEEFKLLLRQAVYNALKLVLSPEDAIGNFFFLNAESIPIELYRKHAPYFSDFDFVIRSILMWYEKNNLERVERGTFMEKFARVVELFEKKEGKSIGQYQRFLFKSLTGKDLDDVLGVQPTPEEPKKVEEPKKQAEPPKQVIEPKKEEEPKKQVISVRPREKAPEKEEEPTKSHLPPWVERKEVILDPVTPLPEEQPAKQPEEPEEEAAPIVPVPVVETPFEETIKTQFPKTQEPKAEDKPRSLNDLFTNKEKEKTTILDQFPKTESKPLVTLQPNTVPPLPEEKIEEPEEEIPTLESFPVMSPDDTPANTGNLSDAGGSKTIRTEQIPVHKQFQFVQKVFGGSSVKFKVILDKINKTTTLAEAEEVLDKYVFNDPNVNRQDKVAKEFELLVRNRFE